MPRVERWIFDWFTINDGAVELRLNDGHEPGPIGWLDRNQTVPHEIDAPTDNYDVYLYDRLDNDLLQGAGANRDTANAEIAAIYNSLDTTGHGWVWCSGPLRLRVENAGPFKRGTLILTVITTD